MARGFAVMLKTAALYMGMANVSTEEEEEEEELVLAAVGAFVVLGAETQASIRVLSVC